MDESTIAAVASDLSASKLQNDVSIKVLKKALDSQKDTAEALISALPALPANPNVGRNINTTA